MINYIPLLLLLGLLVFLGTYLDRFKWIVLSLPILVILICIYSFITQMRTRYIIHDETVEIIYTEKRKVEIKHEDIVTIRELQKSIEVHYKHKDKIKTHYFNWLMKDYKSFKEEYFNKLISSKMYDKIIFVD